MLPILVAGLTRSFLAARTSLLLPLAGIMHASQVSNLSLSVLQVIYFGSWVSPLALVIQASARS